MLKTISPRAREMLRLRFAEDMTEAETVALSSQMQVSGILREAVARLRGVAEQQRLGCG
jgi:RNA polymerase sigma-B factor